MFNIDKMSRTPLYEQLIEQFESCILSGDIGEDGKLPSVRYLSQHLNINPNTLQRAYAEIERRGLCYSVPGNGRFISPDAPSSTGTPIVGSTNLTLESVPHFKAIWTVLFIKKTSQ